MNDLNFNKIMINTVAKVGSANFLNCKYLHVNKVEHTHNILKLKNTLENDSNCLIIVGVRNPIDRNLSYLFQTYTNNFYNDVKTNKNNYIGEHCYIKEMLDKNVSVEKIIELYFKQNYHNTFNDWFEEFLNITNIKHFDKHKGVDFYKFPNNNTIMIYTLEKLSQNQKYITDKLKILGQLNNSNDSNKRNYKNTYDKVKKNIVYDKQYLNNLLNTDIMRLFYTDSDIESFFSKYKIKRC